jgi:ubiquinone/menaquinone biosynthesis C-methylase UbiE
VSKRLNRIRRHYDRDPAAYHRSMSSSFTERLLAGRRRKVGETMPKAGRVLDVGFGTGLSLPYYPAGLEVVGIDVSKGMLAYGREMAARGGRRVELAVMDAERLAFPSQSFDGVTFNLCLCTIPNPEVAISEALRVAKPGAALTFLEHVRSHVLPIAIAQDLLNPVLVALEEDHFNRRTADVVRRAGVEVDSIDRWLLGFFNLIAGHAPGAPGGALRDE